MEENKQNNPAAERADKSAEQKVDNTTLMAVLAYIGPLVVIPYMTAKENSFVKFHIKQGLVLLIIEIFFWFVSVIALPLIMFLWIFQLAILGLSIMGIINAVNHKEVELPVVGSFSKYILI